MATYRRQYAYEIDFVHLVTRFGKEEEDGKEGTIPIEQLFTTRSVGTVVLLSGLEHGLPAEIHKLKPTEKPIYKFIKSLKYDAIKRYMVDNKDKPALNIDNVHLISTNKFVATGPTTKVE